MLFAFQGRGNSFEEIAQPCQDKATDPAVSPAFCNVLGYCSAVLFGRSIRINLPLELLYLSMKTALESVAYFKRSLRTEGQTAGNDFVLYYAEIWKEKHATNK